MRLSVIIVSYNVYPFLDNCLRSVQKSMKGIDGEIFVVDNASVDRTPQLVQQHFPDVKLMANPDNKGFAKANNQAISVCEGEYILLLNPDTIVSEDTLTTCIQFMDTHKDAGAIGVKLLDGSGRFLPESKRGLPTLSASFMKMSGLYRLFPRSSRWNAYYQGHIDENQTAQVEVLCGAFMFMRKEALGRTGNLDEDFYMYGEDIDLSYRISKAGYSIYYVPSTSIIHYKGESTRKSSLNYILTFYQAMLIFTKKHPEFRGQQFLTKVAIYVHGVLRVLRQSVSNWWPVALDGMLVAGSFLAVSKIWEQYYFGQSDYFRPSFYYFNIPLYTFLSVAAMYLNGAYDKPYTRKASWLGFFSGLVMILVIYAFLPIHLRTSRMVIVMGSFVFSLSMLLTRSWLSPWRYGDMRPGRQTGRKAIIVAGAEEAGRIKELINRSKDQIEIIGSVSPDAVHRELPLGYIGQLSQLEDIIRVHGVKEIIFSAQDVPFSAFTGSMTRLGPNLRYMLAASTTMNIVGSMSKDTEGEFYAIRVHFKISDPSSKRAKRLFDFFSAALFLLLFPVLVFFIQNRLSLLKNIIKVLTGKKTWVSYHPSDPMMSSLPPIPEGVLFPVYPLDESDVSRRLRHIHYVYARDYHWTTDLSILTQQWRKTSQTNSGYAHGPN